MKVSATELNELYSELTQLVVIAQRRAAQVKRIVDQQARQDEKEAIRAVLAERRKYREVLDNAIEVLSVGTLAGQEMKSRKVYDLSGGDDLGDDLEDHDEDADEHRPEPRGRSRRRPPPPPPPTGEMLDDL